MGWEKEMNSFTFRSGNGDYIVDATVVNCGNDLNISIGGGINYHIGAVALAVPRLEYKENKKRTATTSLLCVYGHREDELAYHTAKSIATSLNCIVCVSIGIHIDNIDNEGINIFINNVHELTDKIIDYFKKLKE
jgi:hypothetical protein